MRMGMGAMRVSVAIAAVAAIVALAAVSGGAADTGAAQRLEGRWIADFEASDDVDAVVEKLIRARGGKPKPAPGKSSGDRGRYRGGPPEQALYDHLAYDDMFEIRVEGEDLLLVHDGEEGRIERRVAPSGGGRTVTASGAAERKDHSFWYPDGDAVVIETRARDSGRIRERYALDPQSGELRLALRLAPTEFPGVIEVVRVFDRAADAPAP